MIEFRIKMAFSPRRSRRRANALRHRLQDYLREGGWHPGWGEITWRGPALGYEVQVKAWRQR